MAFTNLFIVKQRLADLTPKIRLQNACHSSPEGTMAPRVAHFSHGFWVLFVAI